MTERRGTHNVKDFGLTAAMMQSSRTWILRGKLTLLNPLWAPAVNVLRLRRRKSLSAAYELLDDLILFHEHERQQEKDLRNCGDTHVDLWKEIPNYRKKNSVVFFQQSGWAEAPQDKLHRSE